MTGPERDDPLRSALFTDLYELTMSSAYFAEGMDGRAVFELFFRRMPHTRSFIIAASKAARVVIVADGRYVVDFGSRRAHGTDAALKVARTSYMAGAAGTSNVLAGKLYGVPIFGTMAHSYIQSHDDEALALRAFAEVHPDTTLLVDTYDTVEGVRTVVELSRDDERPLRVAGILLDSGDLGELARQSRRLLDEGGLEHVKIFASSGLDEYTIRALVESGVPIDGFSITTSHLHTRGNVPGIAADEFQKLAAEAKKGCPVSRALGAIEITLQAELAS